MLTAMIVISTLPFLESLLPRGARAQAAPPPLRFGVFFSPNGVIEAGVLPAPLPRLLGREEIIGQLMRDLSATRLLTIAGPGGMGKTSVAMALAAEPEPLRSCKVVSAGVAARPRP